MKRSTRILLPVLFAVTASGAFAEGPIHVEPAFESTLSRAQVRAEAAEALRLGLHNPGEATVVATPAQVEQIRLAGLRAVQGSNLAAGQGASQTN